MNVDIMATGDGWFSCANWCGRDTNVRGNFCAHCAWMDAFRCVEQEIRGEDDWYNKARWEVWHFEVRQPYRGSELVLDIPE